MEEGAGGKKIARESWVLKTFLALTACKREDKSNLLATGSIVKPEVTNYLPESKRHQTPPNVLFISF